MSELKQFVWNASPEEFLQRLEEARRAPRPSVIKPARKRKLLDVEVPGQPVGKGRPRFTRKGHVYSSAKTVKWERKAAEIFKADYQKRRSQTYKGAASLEVEAVAQRPKGKTRKRDPNGRIWRTVKPDGDNVLKIVADAIEKARVIENDKQIVEWSLRSYYGGKTEEPSVIVRLFALEAGT
jgi:Holliday junction resolvase RusA-like endonuclease